MVRLRSNRIPTVEILERRKGYKRGIGACNSRKGVDDNCVRDRLPSIVTCPLVMYNSTLPNSPLIWSPVWGVTYYSLYLGIDNPPTNLIQGIRLSPNSVSTPLPILSMGTIYNVQGLLSQLYLTKKLTQSVPQIPLLHEAVRFILS